jgi:hypothetical protein
MAVNWGGVGAFHNAPYSRKLPFRQARRGHGAVITKESSTI